MSVSVSLIIPAYGPSPHILELLDAVKGGTIVPAEFIISHSAHDDPTELLREHHPDVRVLHSDVRLFAGAARNRGAQVARFEALAFCDSDVLPDRSWLQNLLAALDNHPNRFVVGSVGVARTGGYWGMSTWLCEFSEQAPWRPRRAQHGGASCNMAVRKADFLGVGMFDETMTPGEDTILFHRLRESGLQQWFEPGARVGHFNQNGFAAFYRHQHNLGLHFAKVRLAIPMKGALAVRFPPLAAGLWLPKSALVIGRVLSDGLRGVGRTIVHLPAILLGSWIWTLGCMRGIMAQKQ